jgi:hypothetical protein
VTKVVESDGSLAVCFKRSAVNIFTTETRQNAGPRSHFISSASCACTPLRRDKLFVRKSYAEDTCSSQAGVLACLLRFH